MKMRRCKYCGWWFEPKDGRQAYCDDECKKEGYRSSWRNGKRRKKEEAKKPEEKKPPSILKVDISKIPTPMLPPTKKVRGMSMEDRKLQKIMEAMKRQREYSDA